MKPRKPIQSSKPVQDNLIKHMIWFAIVLAALFIGLFLNTNRKVDQDSGKNNQTYSYTTISIAKQFACSCGSCDEENLAACECPTALSTKRFIERNLNNGLDENEVIDLVTDLFGYYTG